MTYAEDIESAAKGENIVAAVIVAASDTYYYDHIAFDDNRWVGPEFTNKVLTWEVARPLLDYNYDKGWGGQDCHDIHVWTLTRVLFIHEYDGSTSVISEPRGPKEWVKS